MFTYLGIDWGSKRCGIAYGELESELILPAVYECSTKDIFSILATEISQKNITHITLGIPKSFKGKPTEVTKKVKYFGQQLIQKFPQTTVTYIQENLTSKIAKQNGATTKEMINHLAACEILKTYFYKLKLQAK